MNQEEKDQYIAGLDKKVGNIRSKSDGSDMNLLLSLPELMTPTLKSIISSTPRMEMDNYCQRYEHFYYLVKFLENFATKIADGTIQA